MAKSTKAVSDANERLRSGDLVGARAAFLRILKSDPDNFDAHFGLLLCERGFTSDEELIAVGAPIGKDEHYKEALRCASGEQKSRLSRVYYAIGDTMAAKLVRCVDAGDLDTARRWEERIRESNAFTEKYDAHLNYASVAYLTKGFTELEYNNIEAFRASRAKTLLAPALRDRVADGCVALYNRLVDRVRRGSIVFSVYGDYKSALALSVEGREAHLALLSVFEKGESDYRMREFGECIDGAIAGVDEAERRRVLDLADTIRVAYDARVARATAETERRHNEKTLATARGLIDIAKRHGAASELQKRRESLEKTVKMLLPIESFGNASELLGEAKRLLAETERGILRAERRRRLKKALISLGVTAAVAAVVFFGVFWFVELGPSIEYGRAEEAFGAGEYRAAMEGFAALDDYRDSRDRATEARYLYGSSLAKQGRAFDAYVTLRPIISYKECEGILESLVSELDAIAVGDVLTFGRYEQNGKKRDGAEEIEWIVLSRDGDELLLISRYVLDYRQLHGDWEDFQMSYVDWEQTDLCDWLNDDFADDAFTPWDRVIFADPRGAIDDGVTLTRSLFLLSRTDFVGVVCPADSGLDRTATATEYAVSKGAPEGTPCRWWLSGTGWGWGDACTSNEIGDLGTAENVDSTFGVRPCVRIDLSK